jgi:hypothetical protein
MFFRFPFDGLADRAAPGRAPIPTPGSGGI